MMICNLEATLRQAPGCLIRAIHSCYKGYILPELELRCPLLRSRVRFRTEVRPLNIPAAHADKYSRKAIPASYCRALPGGEAAMPRMNQSAFDRAEGVPDFWALSDRQLARICFLIAEGRCAFAGARLRAQATRVYMVWRDALKPRSTNEGAEYQAAALAALRKRTIQILINLTSAPRAVPAR